MKLSLYFYFLQIVVDRNISSLMIGLTESQDGSKMRTNEITQFSVSLETASRNNTSLEINFGDGDIQKYALRYDSSGTDTNPLLNDVDFIAVTASYDEGCLLEVDIEHVYTKEGVFRVSVAVFSEHVHRQSAELTENITVLSQITGPVLHMSHNSVVAVNKTFKVSATFQQKSVTASYIWTLVNEDSGVKQTILTSQPNLEHVFTDLGNYRVKLTAQNNLGSVDADPVFINVQRRLVNLVLSSPSENDLYFPVGHTLLLEASLDDGSDVKFKWNVDGSSPTLIRMTNVNLTSLANITFKHPGVYIASVKAWNQLGKMSANLSHHIIVQEPISGLFLQSSGTVLLGLNFTLVIQVKTGTDVTFEVNFGDGNKQTVSSTLERDVRVNHTYTACCNFTIVVKANNNVMRNKVTTTMEVEVQRDVGKLAIWNNFTPEKDQPVVFVAKIAGMGCII